MPSFIKSNTVDKDLLCETVYRNFIADTSEFIDNCEKISVVLRTKLPSGCYTNFRDALFHFRRLAKSSEEIEITRQAFAVEEHSNRAKTDAIVCILEYCSFLLQIISHEDYALGADTLQELLVIKNRLDRNAMHLRLSGIMLDHTNILRITDEEFENSVKSFLDFIRNHVGRDKFKLAIEELKSANA